MKLHVSCAADPTRPDCSVQALLYPFNDAVCGPVYFFCNNRTCGVKATNSAMLGLITEEYLRFLNPYVSFLPRTKGEVRAVPGPTFLLVA